jgi:transcriptional regulator with XRE-family HTH domain
MTYRAVIVLPDTHRGRRVTAVSNGHGAQRGAGLTPEQRRQRDSQAGRHAQAQLRARIEREVDPDATLSPGERARRVQAAITKFYAERSKRSASVRAQRRATRPSEPVPARRPGTDTPLTPLDDPAMFEDQEMRAALSARDITLVYRLLYQHGVTQREIARRTGQSQSEVSDILKGRTVRDVTVLERIADGLGIPRGRMRLAGVAASEDGFYGGEVTDADLSEESIAEMFRRHLLALGAITVAGAAVVGELVELPNPAPVPLPSQLNYVHVGQVRDLIRRLGLAGNASAAEPTVLSAAAAWAEQLLGVPGTELVRRELMVAVAELHIEAGWEWFDAGHYHQAVHHFTTALELATEAGDAYLQSTALQFAGMATVEHGHLDDGLKFLQFSLVNAWEIPGDEQRAVVIGQSGRAAQEATVRGDIAIAMADLGKLDAANVEMAKSRELWLPTRADRYGDVDRPAALLALRRGRLDVAESLAAASVRRWEGVSQTGRTHSAVVLAAVHVRAGEPGGLALAHGAITAVPKLSSVRVRKRLVLLADELAARPGADAKDLSRMAHQIAGVRA